jgi:hypothetical protein
VNILERNKMTAKTPAIKSALTAAQRNYLAERLQTIANAKQEEERNKLFGADSYYYRHCANFRPTLTQILAAAKAGKLKVKKGCEDRTGFDLDYVEWDEQEKVKATHEKNVKVYQAFCDKINADKQRIMDGVMLGTADDAMAALENFAK